MTTSQRNANGVLYSRTGQESISAVITSFYEERTLDIFYDKLKAALEATGRPYEIIMVNDGSKDDTFGVMRRLYERDAKITAAADFFKNAGQLAAWTAGISLASGDMVLLIDSDLQLEPSELPRLLEQFDRGYDVVSGYREHRRDSWTRIVPSKLANMIMRKVSQSNLRDFGCTFKLYDRRLLLAQHLGPYKIFNTAEIISQTWRIAEVAVTHHARPFGKSGWTFRKLWLYNMDNIINLSQMPFQVIGVACAIAAVAFIGRLVVEYFAPFKILPEVSNGLILNALIIMSLIIIGILAMTGEFIIRSYAMLNRKPRYAIRQLLRRPCNFAQRPSALDGTNGATVGVREHEGVDSGDTVMPLQSRGG